jgi:nucleotide-binding universal stress UspA family protein
MSERPRVVVGIDGSAESRAALQFALEDAARRGQGVRSISVVTPPQYWPEAYGLAAPPTVGDVKRDLRRMARRMLDDVLADRPDLAAVPVELHQLEGLPGRVLVEQSHDADLLVVGHRGRGGLTSAVLGSVGLQCVQHARCPVAVVRLPAQPRPAAENAAGRRDVARAGKGGPTLDPLC